MDGKYEIEEIHVPVIENEPCYELRNIPECLNLLITDRDKAYLPFFKGNIEKSNKIWNKFRFKEYKPSELFELY